MAETQKAKSESHFRKQRETLEHLRKVKLTLDENFKARYDGYQALRSDGIVSKDDVLRVRQDYINNQVEIANLELQMREAELQELRASESYQQQMDLVANLQTKLRELEIQAKQI